MYEITVLDKTRKVWRSIKKYLRPTSWVPLLYTILHAYLLWYSMSATISYGHTQGLDRQKCTGNKWCLPHCQIYFLGSSNVTNFVPKIWLHFGVQLSTRTTLSDLNAIHLLAKTDDKLFQFFVSKKIWIICKCKINFVQKNCYFLSAAVAKYRPEK